MGGLFWQVGGWMRRYDFPLKGLAAVLVLVAFIILLRALPVEGPFRWVQEKVEDLGPWAPVVFVALFVGLTAVLLPGWPLNVASGALFGPWMGGLLTSIGSTSAAAVSFLIGRYLAHGWVARKVPKYPRIKALYDALAKEGGWKIVAAVRLSHSLPFGLQNILLGVSPVGFVPYLITTWIITLPGIFMIAYLGYLAGTALAPGAAPDAPGPWQWALRIGGLVVAGAALFYLGRFVFRAIKNRAPEEPEEERPAGEGSRATSAWPWGTAAALMASLLLLAAAVWCYLERDSLRELLMARSASVPPDPPSGRPL